MILLMMVDTPEEKRKFVILYENYRYLMLKVAVDILHDYQLAEDAVQEAFVRVAKHMEKRRTAGGDCHETLSDYDYKTCSH